VKNDGVEHAFKGERIGGDVIVHKINPDPIAELPNEGVIEATLLLDQENPRLFGAVLLSPWIALSGNSQWLSHS
jgi:hypothetical protein